MSPFSGTYGIMPLSHQDGELYSDLGPDHYRRRDPARTTKRLVAQFEALGHAVTLQEAAA